MDGKAWLDALLGDELVEVRLKVREPDVVFVKGIMEASEGLGAMFAEPRKRGHRGARDDRDGGALVIVAPRSRAADLYELIEDLKIDLGGCLWRDDISTVAAAEQRATDERGAQATMTMDD